MLAAFAREHAARGIEVVGYTRLYDTVDGAESSDEYAELAAFLDRLEIGYPVLVAESNEVHTAFSISRLPTTVLIDRGEVVLYRTGQDGTEEVLEAAAARSRG